jgi:uncharacterized protein YciI
MMVISSAALILQRNRLPKTLALALFASSSSAYLIPRFFGIEKNIGNTTRRNYRGTTSMMSLGGNNKNYILRYDYVPDILDRRDPYRPGHLELAKRFIGQGKCLYGGPTSNPGMAVPSGALFVFTDEESATVFAKEDPYMSAGLITGHSIQEWNVILSKDAS